MFTLTELCSFEVASIRFHVCKSLAKMRFIDINNDASARYSTEFLVFSKNIWNCTIGFARRIVSEFLGLYPVTEPPRLFGIVGLSPDIESKMAVDGNYRIYHATRDIIERVVRDF